MPFAIAAVPVVFVPMKLPFTALFVAPVPVIAMLLLALPEITLRAAAVLPPIVLPDAPLMVRPELFLSAAVPVAFVPMKLPNT